MLLYDKKTMQKLRKIAKLKKHITQFRNSKTRTQPQSTTSNKHNIKKGGIIGPGRFEIAKLKLSNFISLHAISHDVGGYLWNYHSIGPGLLSFHTHLYVLFSLLFFFVLHMHIFHAKIIA